MRKELYPHQKDLVQSIVESWKRGHIPYADACVGFGKSLCLAHLSEIALKKERRVLQIVPSKELCQQNYDEMVGYTDYKSDVGIVCAGLGKKQYYKRCVIGTYHSIIKSVEKLGAFDMLLIDEADIVNPKTETSIRRIVFELQQLKPKMLIAGVTGSPYRMDQGALHFDTPDGPALFTERCYQSNIPYMIENGFWSKPEYLTTATYVDIEGIPMAGKDYDPDIMGVKFHAIVKDAVLDLKAKFAKYEIDTAIIFASNVANAHEIAELWGNDEIRVISGDMPKKERESALDWLKSSKNKRYLINVGILIRGFNFPNLHAVVYLTATASIAKYVQAGGRGARVAEGKDRFYVIDYGTNVQRHGRLEVVEPPEPPKRRENAPKKLCLACNTLNALSARKCKQCDMVFVSVNDEGLYAMKSQAQIDEEKSIQEHLVGEIDINYEIAASGKPILVISFYEEGALKPFIKQILCLDHSGKAREIANFKLKEWFANSSDYYKLGSVGHSVENMAKLMTERPEFFRKPKSVVTHKKPGERWREIRRIEWKEKRIDEIRRIEWKEKRIDERKLVNGMLTIHDEIFKAECHKLGVDWQEWIDEPVEYRDLILEELKNE